MHGGGRHTRSCGANQTKTASRPAAGSTPNQNSRGQLVMPKASLLVGLVHALDRIRGALLHMTCPVPRRPCLLWSFGNSLAISSAESRRTRAISPSQVPSLSTRNAQRWVRLTGHPSITPVKVQSPQSSRAYQTARIGCQTARHHPATKPFVKSGLVKSPVKLRLQTLPATRPPRTTVTRPPLTTPGCQAASQVSLGCHQICDALPTGTRSSRWPHHMSGLSDRPSTHVIPCRRSNPLDPTFKSEKAAQAAQACQS